MVVVVVMMGMVKSKVFVCGWGVDECAIGGEEVAG